MAMAPSAHDFHGSIGVDGIRVTIRPIEPADRERETDFVRKLSQTPRFDGYASQLGKQLAPDEEDPK